MYYKLPTGPRVVSTDCPFGPREILDEGKYGLLVPVGDFGKLSIAMRTALSEPQSKAV
jgi:glycosyltransferase involved in cell wall biosynthesis